MKASVNVCHRILLISAGLLAAVTLVLAVGVIPPVKTDTFPLATPNSAVTGFLVSITANVLAAATLGFIATRITGLGRFLGLGLSLLAFTIFLFNFVLIDAGIAFRSHGPAMQTASTLLFICSAAGCLAAALTVLTAFLLPKQP